MKDTRSVQTPDWLMDVEQMDAHLAGVRDEMFATHAHLKRELTEVGRLQRSFLPAALPPIPGFDVASYYRPCALAGGDYFDVVPLDGGVWGLIMADVTGHGVSATVIMAVMRALVHAHLPLTTQYMSSQHFLEFMNRQMSGVYTPDGRFVTVWCAVLDQFSRTLTYASAGHNPPRLIRNGAVFGLDAVGGLPLGIDASAAYDEVTIGLETGDLLALYTDGFTEAMRDEGNGVELFGTDRFDQVLMACGGIPAADCITRITHAVNEFSQSVVPTDDQTLLMIRVE